VLTASFDYDLPDELIAQHPIEPRDQSRLMVVDRKAGRWEHRIFADLPELLSPGDTLVRNDTRVVPARLIGRREATGGRWEGLFLRELPDGCWEMLATTRGRPSPGERVVVGQGLRLRLEGRDPAGNGSGSWVVRPELDPDTRPGDAAAGRAETPSTARLLEQHGQTPLPPYIRKGTEAPGDRTRYQTIYARNPGAVAAPTAGLHFTDAVFERLAVRRVSWVDVTLHVGVGTFRPIEAEQIEDHAMHAEWAELTEQAAATLRERRAEGGRTIAVGTTSVRVLETAAASGTWQPFSGPTNLYLRPGHEFQGLDALLTNFHLPRSSLLVLVSALAGVDLIRAAYQEAVRQRYRFYSYGDAMLIL
jgi:S-adenosylmethionine:tRNA ribosyltransferase-isomerase